MRKLILVAALAALTMPAVTALAQEKGPTPEEIAEKRDKADLDRQYKNALKAMKGTAAEQAKNNDPWASVRGAGTAPKR